TEWNKNDGNGWGFGLKGGMLIKFGEKLNLGITASLPFDITVSGISKLEFYMPKNSTLIQGSDSADIKNLGTPGNLLIAGSKVVDTADYKTTLNLPPSMAFGIAYNMTERLTVAFDAEYTFWSQYQGLNFAFTNHRGLSGAADTSSLLRNFITSDLTNPTDWDNSGKVMLGVRYKLSNVITFLAGGSADQSPSRVSTIVTPQYFDTGDKYTYSSGLIFHYQQWDFGLVTSYTTYPDLTIYNLEDFDNDDLVDNFNGLYKGNSYETVLSFNYRF
ncbi:MAG: OmpP1/FadL family transporter, partial [Candidatus Zixiibacteriota bacterium]